jgi:hypothetical protein
MRNNKFNNKNKKKDDKDKDKKRGDKPAVKEIAKRPASCVKELLRDYALPVAKGGNLSHLLLALGVRALELPGWIDPIGHPVAHYIRDLLRLDAARDAATMFDPATKQMSIWDVFGRPGDYKGPSAEPGVMVNIVATRPNEFAGDGARVILPQMVEGFCHVATMVDIYQQHDWRTPLSATFVASVARLTMGGTCYIIAHNPREMIGGAVYTASVGMEGGESRRVFSKEEVWWPGRDNAAMSEFIADANAAPYPLHPMQLDWLLQKVHQVPDGWLHVSELVSFGGIGSMHLWKCRLTRVEPLPVGPVLSHPKRYRTLVLEQWEQRLRMIFPVAQTIRSMVARLTDDVGEPERFEGRYWMRTWANMVIYDAYVSMELQDQVRFKLLGGRLLQTLSKDVKLLMAASQGNAWWMECNPELADIVAHNTLLHAILCASDSGQVEAIDWFRQEHAEEEEARARIAKASPYPRRASVWGLGTKVGFSVAATMATLLISRANPRVGAAFGAAATALGVYMMGRKADSGVGAVLALFVDQARKTVMWALRQLQVTRTATTVWGKVKQLATMAISEVMPDQTTLLAGPLATAWHVWSTQYKLMAEGAVHSIGVTAFLSKVWASAVRPGGFWRTYGSLMIAWFGLSFFAGLMTGRGKRASLGWNEVGSLLEEGFKWYSPPLGACAALGEAAAYVFNGTPALDRCPALGFHLASCVSYHFAPWSLPLWCAGHLAFNEWIEPDWDFDDWALDWAAGRLSTKVGVRPIPSDVRFRAFEAMPVAAPEWADWRLDLLCITDGARRVSLGEVDDMFRMDNCECRHTGRCQDCKAAPYLGFSWPLVVMGLLYQPAPGFHSDIAATVLRAFKDPTEGHMRDAESELAFYDRVRDHMSDGADELLQILRRFAPQPEELPSIAECARVMGGLRGKNLLDVAAAMDVGNMKYNVKMMSKYNETIKGQGVTIANGAGAETVALKPRIIRNVDTEYQVDTLPEARILKEQLCSVFDGNHVFVFGRYRVRIVIAKVVNLDAYAKLLHESAEAVIIVSCDDCVFSGGRHAGTRVFPSAFGENDFSAWDQSQLLPLWEWFIGACDVLGLSQEFALKILSTAVAKFATRRGTCTMRGIAHCQMATGCAVTSDLGSLFDIMMWAVAMTNDLDFRASCRLMGVETKMQLSDKLEGCTFLKGWFCPDEQGVMCWSNLPSCVLKMGKIFRNPVNLSGLADPSLAALACQGAICASFPKIEESYPIVGAYLVRIQELLRAEGLEEQARHISLNRYVVENAVYKKRGLVANRPVVLRLVEERYGISEDEVLSLERLLRSVSRLPCVISHPALQKLIDVDYQ